MAAPFGIVAGRIQVRAGVHVRLHQHRALAVAMVSGDVRDFDGRELRPRRHPIAPWLREIDNLQSSFLFQGAMRRSVVLVIAVRTMPSAMTTTIGTSMWSGSNELL